MLTRWEKYVHNFIIDIELAREHKIQSANIVKYSVKLWYLLQTQHSKSSIQYFQVKRKLLQAFNNIHQIKITQRELIDSCVDRYVIIYHKSGYHKCIPKSHPHLWIMKSKKNKTGNQVGILIWGFFNLGIFFSNKVHDRFWFSRLLSTSCSNLCTIRQFAQFW